MVFQHLTAENISANGYFLLEKIRPLYAYDTEGKPTTAVIGSKLACLTLPNFERITVKLPVAPEDISLTNEQIEETNSSANLVVVSFEAMEVKPYYRDGQQHFSCSADSFTVVGKRKDG